MPADILLRYFPKLSDQQIERFQQLIPLYREWNNQVNVISRKDIDNLLINHILHSLSIIRFIKFNNRSKIIDIGTGGGFPGIPLAIYYENCHFTLIDSIGKKINVVKEIAGTLKINNVSALQVRSVDLKGSFDYIVSRALTNLPSLISQCKHLVKNGNGIVYLKGGDFIEELQQIKRQVTLFEISDIFKEPFFETKKVVFIRFGKNISNKK